MNAVLLPLRLSIFVFIVLAVIYAIRNRVPNDRRLVGALLAGAGSPACAVLVGHDPDFTELLGELVAGAGVDGLANQPAGAQVRFQTDSPSLSVRVAIDCPPNMDHMPATGQCGVDCYVGAPRAQRFWSIARPAMGKSEYEASLFADLPSALANTVEIAKRCNLGLVLGKPQLPDFATPLVGG